MSRIALPLLVLMVATAACTEQPAVQPTPRGDTERPPAQPTPREDEDLITEIRKLASLLSTAPLRVATVVRRIGSITRDDGQGGLHIAPSKGRFLEIRMDGKPETVDPTRMTVDW